MPISSRLHPREAADIVARGHAKLCFATADTAAALVAETPVPVIVFGEAEDAALAAAAPADPVPRLATDDAWTFFTSGTTGKPKGARLRHGNLFAMAAAYLADADAVGPRDSMIHVAAFSHASGLMSLPFLMRGAAQVLPPSGGFDADELLDLVQAGERSTFFVPPTLLRRLAAHPRPAPPRRDRDDHRQRRADPSRRPARHRRALGPVVWNGYGRAGRLRGRRQRQGGDRRCGGGGGRGGAAFGRRRPRRDGGAGS